MLQDSYFDTCIVIGNCIERLWYWNKNYEQLILMTRDDGIIQHTPSHAQCPTMS